MKPSCHHAKNIKNKSIDVDFFNPSRAMDMEHVHDCAEHFGKCSIQELEDMRTALHTERIQHQSAGFQPDFAEELDHRLLEEDLEFQLALLKDEMHTLPRWSSPHFMNNGKPSFTPPPIMVQSGAGSNDNGSSTVAMTQPPSAQSKNRNNSNIQSFMQRAEELFLIPNGLGDIVAFGCVLLILAFAPYFFQ